MREATMKLRIRGNTVRLRLSQTDVTKLEQDGSVTEQTRFGPGSGQALSYSLETAEGVQQVCARFADSTLRVLLPPATAAGWLGTDQVGIEATQDLGNGDALGLLIEKDFQCLVPRDGEDQSEGFPNPSATK